MILSMYTVIMTVLVNCWLIQQYNGYLHIYTCRKLITQNQPKVALSYQDQSQPGNVEMR